jgi:hypothetical protein
MGKKHRDAVREFEAAERSRPSPSPSTASPPGVPQAGGSSQAVVDHRRDLPVAWYSAEHKFIQPPTVGLNERGYANTHAQLSSARTGQRFILGNHPVSVEPHTHLSTRGRQLSFQGIINVLCHEGQHEALQRLLVSAALSNLHDEAQDLYEMNLRLDTPSGLYVGVDECLDHLTIGANFFRAGGFDDSEWERITNEYHFMGSCKKPHISGPDQSEWNFDIET